MAITLSLPPELTIYTVPDLRSAWLQFLEQLDTQAPGEAPEDDRIALDASRIDDLDGAGVQLLLSLARSLRERQRRLVLVQPSEIAGRACRCLGVERILLDEPVGEAPV